MKTPKRILLEQTRASDSRLEDIQRAVITSCHPLRPRLLPLLLWRRGWGRGGNIPQTLWFELILPARRLWLSYTFIWLAIAAFYIATSDRSITRTAKIANQSEAVANWKEQQIILVELLRPAAIEPADRPKEQQMRPRSEACRLAIG